MVSQYLPIDLICVIDISGSMSGLKMQRAKLTLEYIVEMLQSKDRLSIILFNDNEKILFPLWRASNINKLKMMRMIKEINAFGGTRINTGMSQAFRIMQQRKSKSPISSIFLLSDGLDNDQNSIQILKQNLNMFELESSIIINTFGFGDDHDAKLLNGISKVRDGNFYYIKDESSLAMVFADALGGLLTVGFKDINIKVYLQNQRSNAVQFNLVELRGDIWQVNQQEQYYQIHLENLLLGVEKQYFLILNMLPSTNKVDGYNENQLVLRAILSAKDLKTEQLIQQEATLVIKIYNFDSDVNVQQMINEDIQLQYEKVRGGEIFMKANQLIQEDKYSEAEKLIEQQLNDIQQMPLNIKKSLTDLEQDLKKAKEYSQPSTYKSGGSAYYTSNANMYTEQKFGGSYGQGNFKNQYSNIVQREMVKQAKKKYGSS